MKDVLDGETTTRIPVWIKTHSDIISHTLYLIVTYYLITGRVEQLTRRQVQIRQDQEESLRAREVLLREMEVLAQETARETGVISLWST